MAIFCWKGTRLTRILSWPKNTFSSPRNLFKNRWTLKSDKPIPRRQWQIQTPSAKRQWVGGSAIFKVITILIPSCHFRHLWFYCLTSVPGWAVVTLVNFLVRWIVDLLITVLPAGFHAVHCICLGQFRCFSMACPADSGEVLHDYIAISCFCIHSCSVGDLLVRPRKHDVYA